MVSMRRRPTFRPALLAFAMLPVLSAGAEGWLAASVTERTALDWRTGLAIYGYDPVAYFSEKGPRPGKAVHEHAMDGATWRFQNEGNRAAFIERPDVYLPRFGGYDPLSVARGVAVAGHPDFWMIHAGGLYLFAGAATRAAFARNPERAAVIAQEGWPAVREALTP